MILADGGLGIQILAWVFFGLGFVYAWRHWEPPWRR